MEQRCQCHHPVFACRRCNEYRCHNFVCPLRDPHLVKCQSCGEGTNSNFACPFCGAILLDPKEDYKQAFNIFQLPDVPQFRNLTNTIKPTFPPALGIATWNVQRVGKGSSKEEDDQSQAIDELYAKVIKLLCGISQNYTFGITRSLRSAQSKDEKRDKIREGINCLVPDNIDTKNFKAVLDDVVIKMFKQRHRNYGAERINLFRMICASHKPHPQVRSAYRKLLLIEHIVEMFIFNPWLDVLMLQEVNMGFTLLEAGIREYASQRGLELYCYPGPLTVSSGGYKEYFPIVVRPGIAVTGCGVADVDKVIEYDIFEGCQKSYPYNKKAETFRPIVFYKIKPREPRDGKEVFVGVVHTTPGGEEFRRIEDYGQIKAPLENLREHTKGRWLVVGGDYYLTAEAVVLPYDNDFNKEKKDRENDWTTRFENAQKRLALMCEIYNGKKSLIKLADLLVKFSRQMRSVYIAKTRVLNFGNVQAAREALKQLDLEIQWWVEEKTPNLFKDCQTVKDIYEALSLLEGKLEEFHIAELQSLKDTPLIAYGNIEKATKFIEEYLKNTEKRCQQWTAALKAIQGYPKYHLIRNECNFTFAKQMEKAKWRLCQTATATSWHDSPEEDTDWSKGSIADFFVCTPDWYSPPVGLMVPFTKGIALTDTEDLVITKYWRTLSDHIPVGGYFTGDPLDPALKLVPIGADNEKFENWMAFIRKTYCQSMLPQLIMLEAADLEPKLDFLAAYDYEWRLFELEIASDQQSLEYHEKVMEEYLYTT